jgi:hypothetical protein
MIDSQSADRHESNDAYREVSEAAQVVQTWNGFMRRRNPGDGPRQQANQ